MSTFHVAHTAVCELRVSVRRALKSLRLFPNSSFFLRQPGCCCGTRERGCSASTATLIGGMKSGRHVFHLLVPTVPLSLLIESVCWCCSGHIFCFSAFRSLSMQSQRALPQEDLNQLDDYNKATIAAHLHKRFKVQRPYTSLGNIVVAVNPFEWLDLYDDDLGLAYQEPGRRDLPAHIYKSTAAAYR